MLHQLWTWIVAHPLLALVGLGGVSEALVRRAVRETPLRGDVTETVRRLVEGEIAAYRRRVA